MSVPQEASIYAQGYRKYTGERTGVAGSMWAVTIYSIRSMLGLGRRSLFKIAPILIIVYAIFIAFTMIGLAMIERFFQDTMTGEGGSDPFQLITLSVSITANLGSIAWFTVFVGPLTMIQDRRDGMFALYLTSPLNRVTYLLSKWAALVMVICLVSIGPGLLVLIGFSFAGRGPGSFADWMLTLARLVLSGVVVAALYAVFTMMVSALSRRLLFASIGTAVVLFVGSVVANILAASETISPRWSLICLPFTAERLVKGIFGESQSIVDIDLVGLGTPWLVLAGLAHLLIPATVIWLRYRKLGVER